METTKTEKIKTETAVVYKTCYRRFFTKRAAAYHLMREMFKERCHCVPFEEETGYCYGCKYHKDSERLEKLKDRMVKRLMRTRFEGGTK